MYLFSFSVSFVSIGYLVERSTTLYSLISLYCTWRHLFCFTCV